MIATTKTEGAPVAVQVQVALPLRFSHLKTLGSMSPAHLASRYQRGPSPSTELGTSVHALMFGTRKVIAYPGAVRRGKEYDRFAADNQDGEIVTAASYAKALAMVDALKRHKYAMAALDGTREETILWDCDGVPSRSTPDVWTPHFVTELKTTRPMRPERFMKHALYQEQAYHAQIGWYAEAVRTAKKVDPVDHHIVSIENEAPFVVTVYRLSPRTIEAGTALWRKWFESFRVCRASDNWPGYTSDVLTIDTAEEMPDLTFEGDPEPDAAPDSGDLVT